MKRFVPAPELIRQSHEDRRQRLIDRIPVHAPGWTDRSPSDPGIALLELFAWQFQELDDRLNRVPQRMLNEFLSLLAIPLRPARPATGWVQFLTPKGDPRSVDLVGGPLTPKPVVQAGPVEFQVTGGLTVHGVEAIAALKAKVEVAPEDHSEAGVESMRDLIEDHLRDDEGVSRLKELQTYQTHVLEAPGNGRLPASVAIAESVDRSLWIALVAPKKDAVEALKAELAGRLVSLGIWIDDSLCGPFDAECCEPNGCAYPESEHRWWSSTGCFQCSEPRIDQLVYKSLAVEEDQTFGMTRTGVVKIRMPSDPSQIGAWREDQLPDPDLFGAGELPPTLEDAALSERVVVWIRGRHPDPEAAQARLRWVDINIVGVEQAVTARPEILGFGKGRPGQSVSLAYPPVIEDSLYLELEELGGWRRWQAVPQLALSRPNDPHFTLDPVSGAIRFGDGVRGRMPPQGARIRARTYRSGGGAQGNLASEAISKVRVGPEALRVTNPFPTSGGQDAELPELARFRIPQMLRHRDRAVAKADFHDLALETPGASVGRVEVLCRHKPHEHVDGVPGIVTLVVVPLVDPRHPDEPVPDREMLRQICLWLEPRRLCTTELCLIPPEYIRLWISAAIEVEACADIQTIARWCDLALRQTLAPLPPYGPDGGGWPFGRDVRSQDLASILLRVEGVRAVNEVSIKGIAINELGAAQELSGSVELRRWQLPSVKNVQIVSGFKAAEIEEDCVCPELPTESIIPVPVFLEPC